MPFSDEKGERDEEEEEEESEEGEEVTSESIINQVDGADTVSESDTSESEDNNNIPVTAFMTRAYQPAPRRSAPQVLQTIPRNTRLNSSNGMPVVAVANVRS